MKAVVDTNAIVSGLFWRGAPARLVEACIDGRITLVASPEIIAEYERVISLMEKKYPTVQSARDVLRAILADAEVVEAPRLHPVVCRDPDDDKFLAAAMAAGAKYVVSGDKDLHAVGRFGRAQVVTPARLLNILEATRR